MIRLHSMSPCYCSNLFVKISFLCILLPQYTFHRTFAVVEYTRKIKMEEIQKNTGYKRFAFMICGYAPAARCVG